MADSEYTIEVTPAAYRDLEHQFLWLMEHRNQAQINALDRAVSECLKGLEHMPERWQRLDPSRQHSRRAVILSRYILFYSIDTAQQPVRVIAFRDAAED